MDITFFNMLSRLVRWVSLVAQTVKHLPELQEAWIQSLSWEDPLEKEMATHSSILAQRTLWRDESGGLQFMESHSGVTLILSF